MKTIGLVGGLSWQSTASYYATINGEVGRRLGGHHSARCVLYSVDFDEIQRWQHEDRWDLVAAAVVDAARRLEQAGAQCLLICANTIHKVAPLVEAAVTIPLLHIADATGRAAGALPARRVGLLGTRFTMESDFYTARLRERFDLEVLVPEAPDREILHRVIFEELVYGEVHDGSRAEYLRIIRSLSRRGAEAVILGCTEIALLIDQRHADVPLLDTTRVHATAAVEWALSAERG